MNGSAVSHYAIVLTAVASMLAACSGPQLPIGAPGVMPQNRTITRAAAHGKSWMLPEAKSDDLVYATAPFSNDAVVYTYPQGTLVGSISDLNRPSGECVDDAGHVFITEATNNTVLEYAHGGTEPIATLYDSYGTPFSCSYDPASGDLAVGNGYNSVSIYHDEQGTPVVYSNPAMTYFYFDAYDNAGNLFVAGLEGGQGRFQLAELPRGRQSFINLTVNAHIYSPGAIEWHRRYLALADGSTNTIYHVKVSGLSGTVTGETHLRARPGCLGYGANDWIVGDKIIRLLHRRCGLFGVWNYPSGGRTIEKFGKAHPHETFYGVTVSLALHR